MDMSHDPPLDAPGAGLPWLELKIARFMVSRALKKHSRADFDQKFRAQRVAIRNAVAEIPLARRGERVLIPRLRGLEDSSRFWSAWMTLDHLRICNEAFAGIITTLASGQVPPGVASTADVKPSPEVGPEIEERYEASCDAFLSASAAVPNLATAEKFRHPWFGPLDAAGWHALGGAHMRIHHGQIVRIADALRR